MRYLLRVNHSNEYADHHQYAVLDIGPELARRVLERRRRVQTMVLADSSLCEMAYFDYSVDWHDWVDRDALVARGWLTDEEREGFETEGIYILSYDAELGDESEGTSYSRMLFYSLGVSWAACGKHDSDEFSTEALSFDVFEGVLAHESAVSASSPTA